MLPARARDSRLTIRTPEHTARVLRQHFAAHNRRVVLLALSTLLASAVLWAIIFGFSCWLFVLVTASLDLPQTRIPRGFGVLFFVAALCAIAYAWIDRRLTPNERPRDDKRPGEIIADFLLAIPRMTLAIGGTLAARQRLSDDDLTLAAHFLHRLAEANRLPMSGVRGEIPDAETAARILFALQITQIIDAHRDQHEFWLKLNPLRPAALRLQRGSYADA